MINPTNPLLLATNALSLSVSLAISMKGRREIRLVPSAKPDLSASKVWIYSTLLFSSMIVVYSLKRFVNMCLTYAYCRFP